MQLDIRNYDMQNAVLYREGHNTKFLFLDVPGLAENRPSVLRGDKIFVQPMNNPQSFKGQVEEVQDTKVKLLFSPRLMTLWMQKMRFNIQFTVSRYPMQTMQRAVGFMAQFNLTSGVVFPNVNPLITDVTLPGNTDKFPKVNFINRSIGENKQQSTAVSQNLSRPFGTCIQ